MKAVVQRVDRARVEIDGRTVSQIGRGLLVFLGIEKDDQPKRARHLARRVVDLRIFADPGQKMNLSVKDVKGEIMIVSQFTLCADTRGRRPSFSRAADPERAKSLYDLFIQETAEYSGRRTASGQFREVMRVISTNQGPVTMIMDDRT